MFNKSYLLRLCLYNKKCDSFNVLLCDFIVRSFTMNTLGKHGKVYVVKVTQFKFRVFY